VTPREARLGAILFVVCVFAIVVKAAAGATIVGCQLPHGVYQLDPLVVPACASLAICDPGGTTYLSTGSLVLPAACQPDAGRVFTNGFEPVFSVVTTRGLIQ
jgi:hypothetical protein